jgi:hypothetical protein
MSGAACRRIAEPFSESPVNEILRIAGAATERRADRAARPRDHVQHAVGEARLARERTEPQRRERRRAGRLQHCGVPGRERRRDLPRCDQEREVPGNDQRARSDRLAQHERHAVPSTGGTLPESVVAAPAKNSKHCAAASTSHSASPIGLPALRASSVARSFAASRMRAAMARSTARPLHRARARPRAAPERARRRVHRALGVADRSLRHRRQALAGGGSSTSAVASPFRPAAFPSIQSVCIGGK